MMKIYCNRKFVICSYSRFKTANTTAFTIPSEVMARVMKTDYGKFVVTNSIPCLRVVLANGTISSAKVTSDGVVTLTAAAKDKLIIDGHSGY